MKRKPKIPEKKKTPVQEALYMLRCHLDLSQAALGKRLGVTNISVARWETSRPPSGIALLQLGVFAVLKGHFEIAKVFRDALREEPASSKQAQRLYEMVEERTDA
jgi:hypothetical protein